MNVPYALLTVMFFGAFAGMVHGVIVYGGVVLPKRFEDKRIKQDDGSFLIVSLFVPGVFGHMIVGAVAGLLTFCHFNDTLVFGYSAQHTPTLKDILFAVLLALGGSAGLNLWIDKKDLLGIREAPPEGGSPDPDLPKPDPADSTTNAATRTKRTNVVKAKSSQQQAAKELTGAGVYASVIQTPGGGIFTNHAFDLYQSLPSKE